MKRLFGCIVLLVSLLLLSACFLPTPQRPMPSETETASASPSAADITPSPSPAYEGPPAFMAMEEYPAVDGSTATIPLAARLLSRACAMPLEEAELYIVHSKTSEAYFNLIYGYVDLLLAYEAPADTLHSAGLNDFQWTATPIGRDALVFLVNEDNPVDSLTEQQIRDIYSGKITNWKEVGGENQAIVPFQRDANSGSQTLMDNLVMRELSMMDAPADYIPGDMGGLIESVKSYDNTASAIGYSVYYYVNNMYDITGIKVLSVEGVAPSEDTISSGKYPYLNDFYAVISSDAKDGSPEKKLYDFLLTPEGAQLIRDSGYVPVR